MKRITVYGDQWGPNFLQSPRTGKKCCLGFACQQLGSTDIRGARMPYEISEIGMPEKVREFNEATCKLASDELLAAATELTGCADYQFRRAVGDVLASVNDWYHTHRSRKSELLEPTLKVLRQGFKEVGYQLVYKETSA